MAPIATRDGRLGGVVPVSEGLLLSAAGAVAAAAGGRLITTTSWLGGGMAAAGVTGVATLAGTWVAGLGGAEAATCSLDGAWLARDARPGGSFTGPLVGVVASAVGVVAVLVVADPGLSDVSKH